MHDDQVFTKYYRKYYINLSFMYDCVRVKFLHKCFVLIWKFYCFNITTIIVVFLTNSINTSKILNAI